LRRNLTRAGNERFPAYLRGIETERLQRLLAAAGRFPAYLRGIETQYGHQLSGLSAGFQPTYEGLKPYYWTKSGLMLYTFPAYLRGIETVEIYLDRITAVLVSSLPTRD